MSGVFAIIKALFSTEGLGVSGFDGLAKEFENTLNEFKKTGTEISETIALPGQFVEALVNPSSQEAQTQANKLLSNTINSITSNGEAINNQTLYSKNQTIIP